MDLESLDIKAAAALEYAHAEGLRLVALLLQGRTLVENFLRGPPGVTQAQCKEFIEKVDELVFPKSPDSANGDGVGTPKST